MKKNAAGEQATHTARAAGTPTTTPPGKIHPVVIYPIQQPKNYANLEELYALIAALDGDKDRYARPITVMDRKTHYAMESNKRFLDFKRGTVARHSQVLDAWCVDTCQMWYAGLGAAFEQGSAEDVYWLIPGDFNYGGAMGKEVLGRLHDLPEIILELQQDLCIGEIAADHNNPKQIIDTYGTFALLYTWFPAEAQEIRQFTERPRSEFFAIQHRFLRQVLQQRWYAYEQTVSILLQAVMSDKRISRFFVGNISDLPEGRESVASAMQQVERTERVLKSFWQEKYHSKGGWIERYRILEKQSDHVRRSALVILQNLLGQHQPVPRFQDPMQSPS